MLLGILTDSMMITGFVFMMLLLIEYVNVLSRGTIQSQLIGKPWRQYVIAAYLGAIPGCLGAFTVVSMYTHGVITIGSLVSAMVATIGDETFIMLALIPGKTIWIIISLLFLGICIGWLIDIVFKRYGLRSVCKTELEIHESSNCTGFPMELILDQWKNCSLARAALVGLLTIILGMILSGVIGPTIWNWERVTLVLITSFGIFIVVTVPDHFLEEHLWEHVAKHHAPKIFLWTLGALLFVEYINKYLDLEWWILNNGIVVLLTACLIGLIPESGPHLVFVTMYIQGVIPLSILLSSSIVQDGHGMLPLLAHSRKDFVFVKTVNFVFGLTVGLMGYFSGW